MFGVAMSESTKGEVTIDDVTPATFKLLLKYDSFCAHVLQLLMVLIVRVDVINSYIYTGACDIPTESTGPVVPPITPSSSTSSSSTSTTTKKRKSPSAPKRKTTKRGRPAKKAVLSLDETDNDNEGDKEEKETESKDEASGVSSPTLLMAAAHRYVVIV